MGKPNIIFLNVRARSGGLERGEMNMVCGVTLLPSGAKKINALLSTAVSFSEYIFILAEVVACPAWGSNISSAAPKEESIKITRRVLSACGAFGGSICNQQHIYMYNESLD